jgi:hypothetical protein
MVDNYYIPQKQHAYDSISSQIAGAVQHAVQGAISAAWPPPGNAPLVIKGGDFIHYLNVNVTVHIHPQCNH